MADVQPAAFVVRDVECHTMEPRHTEKHDLVMTWDSVEQRNEFLALLGKRD